MVLYSIGDIAWLAISLVAFFVTNPCFQLVCNNKNRLSQPNYNSRGDAKSAEKNVLATSYNLLKTWQNNVAEIQNKSNNVGKIDQKCCQRVANYLDYNKNLTKNQKVHRREPNHGSFTY